MMCPTFIFQRLLVHAFLNRNSASNGHADHRVVAGTERALPRGGIPKKKPSPNLYLIRFKRVFVCAFVDTMWTNLFLSTSIIPYLYSYVNAYHQMKHQERERIERSTRPALICSYYKPSNCFFFASNSSWVITPLSSNSLNFFSSSALL